MVSTQPKCKKSHVLRGHYRHVSHRTGGGSLSQRWQLSELNQRVRGASRRTVNKSERRAPCATDSWLAFVTVDRIYIAPVYTPGFNFAFQTHATLRGWRSSETARVVCCRWRIYLRFAFKNADDTFKWKEKKTHGALSRNSRSSSRQSLAHFAPVKHYFESSEQSRFVHRHFSRFKFSLLK